MASKMKSKLVHDFEPRHWDWPLQAGDEGFVRVTNNEEKFEVRLDIQHFGPKEIDVKVMGSELMVQCRQELKDNNNGVPNGKPREVLRAYRLPPDIDFTTMSSHLTSKGKLLISAEKLKN